jgi:hypothetical protein
MKRKRMPLPELPLADTAFRLVPETGVDPERLAREEAKRLQDERARLEFEWKAQTSFALNIGAPDCFTAGHS